MFGRIITFCIDRHLVFLYFRQFSGGHCGFTTESRKKLPREFAFNGSATLRELARRGNGLIGKWDREELKLDLEIGKGGIWLRLSDEQYIHLEGCSNRDCFWQAKPAALPTVLAQPNRPAQK